ncbi:MAG TPA: hypothetical protein VIH35_06650, partial [Kiritimatiellia bacterium]
MLPRVEGFVVYLLVCCCAVLAGRGLLRALRIEGPPRALLLFSAPATLVFWTLFIGIGVGLGAPVRLLAPWFWAASLGFAAYGFAPVRASLRDGGGIVLVCLAAPVVLMSRFFAVGLTDFVGSIVPDSWSYVTCSEYMWEHSRSTEGGLSPAFQYAAHLNTARYISRGLISVFSPLTHIRDTQASAALYQAFTMFTLAGASAFFLTVVGLRRRVAAAGAFFAVVGGWMANVIWSCNYDNGLELTYMPTVAGALLLLDPRDKRGWVVAGALLAAAIYAYVELAPLTLACAGLMALPRIVRDRAGWGRWILAGVAAGVVAAVLLVPQLRMLVSFWQGQFNSVNEATAARTAEGCFIGIKFMVLMPGAVWGLGHEHMIVDHILFRNGLGVLLGGLAFVGMVCMVLRRQWGYVAAVLLLLGLTWYWAAVRDYSYAAYKMMNLNWWALAACVVIGADGILERFRHRAAKAVIAVGLAVVALAWISQSRHGTARSGVISYAPSVTQDFNAPEFRRVQEIVPILDGAPVLNLVQDWLAHEWSVYYLRDILMAMPTKHMLMAQAQLKPFLARARYADAADCRHALTDYLFDPQAAAVMGWKRVWAGGAYQLWELPSVEQAARWEIFGREGLDLQHGRPVFWLGKASTTITICSGRDGIAMLSAWLIPGPALVPGETCRMRVKTSTGVDVELNLPAIQAHAFSVPVVAGT